MATLVAPRARSNGKAQQSTSHGIHHTSLSSTRVSSRCDMLNLVGCARLFLVPISGASGTDVERHYLQLPQDPTELGRRRHHKRHGCTELCAPTIRQRGAVHLVQRVVWCNTYLN